MSPEVREFKISNCSCKHVLQIQHTTLTNLVVEWGHRSSMTCLFLTQALLYCFSLELRMSRIAKLEHWLGQHNANNGLGLFIGCDMQR